jgi:hypothetical protein
MAQTQEQKVVFSNKKEIEKVVKKELENEKEKAKKYIYDYYKNNNITEKEIETLMYKYIYNNFNDFESFVYRNIEKLYRKLEIEIETEIKDVIEFTDNIYIYVYLELPDELKERDLNYSITLYPFILIPHESENGRYYVCIGREDETNIYRIEIKKDRIENLDKFRELYRKGNKIKVKFDGLYKDVPKI